MRKEDGFALEIPGTNPARGSDDVYFRLQSTSDLLAPAAYLLRSSQPHDPADREARPYIIRYPVSLPSIAT